MQTAKLYNLTNYLNESTQEFVFLKFDEIESIIETNLSESAKKAGWWNNRPEWKHTETWLSAGFYIYKPKLNIQMRGGIEFRKYAQTKRNYAKYNRLLHIIIDFATALIISILTSVIISEFQQKAYLKEEIATIDSLFASDHYEEVEERIIELTPKLEKKRKFEELSKLYNSLLKMKYEQYVLSNSKLDDRQISFLVDTYHKSVSYSKEDNNILYILLANNIIGIV